jgi:hypothetical protein
LGTCSDSKLPSGASDLIHGLQKGMVHRSREIISSDPPFTSSAKKEDTGEPLVGNASASLGEVVDSNGLPNDP